MGVVEAAKRMQLKWSATWQNDSFVQQLLEYEQELGITGTPGVVDMKVTTKKSVGFYISAARALLQGGDAKDGTAREAACVLNISGLGEAVNIAAATAAAIEREGVGNIHKIETSYPELTGSGSARGYPRLLITIYHK